MREARDWLGIAASVRRDFGYVNSSGRFVEPSHNCDLLSSELAKPLLIVKMIDLLV